MSKTKKSIEQVYQKKDLHEHILHRPSMFIGSVSKVDEEVYLVENQKFVKKNVAYVPGFLKIFDEILVNALDHTVRDPSVKQIKVTIDKETGVISVFNDGQGIPCVIHKEYLVYIPELIFGNLLTSSNYDDSVERITGGVNGLGSKLVSVFSKKFKVETVDSVNQLKFVQEYSDNMYKKTKPVVTPTKSKSYTKITFLPDYQRFKMDSLGDDSYNLLVKRVYDAAACTPKTIIVSLNDKKIEVQQFQDYIKMYTSGPILYERIEKGKYVWEIAVMVSDSFQQVSFVNGISTIKGGKHVDYIVNQIKKKLGEMITSKRKLENFKDKYIRDALFVFVKASINQPDFTSQSKEELKTPASAFGIKPELSDKFITDIYKKSGIVEEVIQFTNFKNKKELEKTSGVASKKSSINVPNLDDANWAGTKKSNQCTLILTEGNSAKTFAISGLSIIGRDKFGIFPLKGKVLNIREATQTQLLNNEEINNIKKIMGLQHNKDYSLPGNMNSLRYNRILILADADVDGKHIMGLILNVFHYWWPSLTEHKGFLTTMRTPIIKVTKSKKTLQFYSIQDYTKWEELQSSKNHTVKYYKGLGTSTAAEAKDCFKQIIPNTVEFTSDSVSKTTKWFTLGFDKAYADQRKKWLGSYNKEMVLDQTALNMSYSEFIDKDLIHFSMYDNIRSIPSMVDGLKPSQRKVLYTCLKKPITKEIKVAQLGPMVAELTEYAHGEVSLFGTIINMAQDFPGSNNINLLEPLGQFGSRRLLGKDAASPRYIFTQMASITPKMFLQDDSSILTYLTEENKLIEPEYYVPIIPLILVNGTQGIGTGYSTFVPSYNPNDIIKNMKRYLKKEPMVELTPWYKDFKGKVIQNTPTQFILEGIIEAHPTKDHVLKITEIPIGVSIEGYKTFLDALIEKNNYSIIEFTNYSTENQAEFDLIFSSKETKRRFIRNVDVLKELKLQKTVNTTNMHLFDENRKIKKYETTVDILNDFMKIRLKYNKIRKEAILKRLNKDLQQAKNKLRFLIEIMNDTIVVYKKKRSIVEKELMDRKYDLIEGTYNYLMNMTISQFTEEKIAVIEKEIENTTAYYNSVYKMDSKDICLQDLEKCQI